MARTKGRSTGRDEKVNTKGTHNETMKTSKLLYMGIGVFVVTIIIFNYSSYSSYHDGVDRKEDVSSRRASHASPAKETIVTKQSPKEIVVTEQRQVPVPGDAPEQTGHGIRVWDYKINAEYPHDTKAFLQGVLYNSGKLYESTGMYGETTVREATIQLLFMMRSCKLEPHRCQVELKTGRVLKQTAVGRQHFGEGLALWQVCQLPGRCMLNLRTG